MIHAHSAFALPAARPRPDAARVLTLSATLVLNLLLFGLLMVPMALPPPQLPAAQPRTPQLRIIPRTPPVVEVTTLPLPPPAAASAQPPTRADRRIPAVSDPAPVIRSDAGPVQAADAGASADAGPGIDATPPGPAAQPMQLAYLSAPAPAYPRAALQQRLSGTVLLQVLVDVDGRPLDVTVARSSGYRMLDEAARMQVLKRWRFQPALQDGQPVQALGLVPVEFTVRG
ncbi:energy transducer TonB [Thermomonas sp.]|uniref:energy transducer TonB n=1 Tax=Thermomonas sp. TaxID=1971895 RepID=UPI003D0BCCFF